MKKLFINPTLYVDNPTLYVDNNNFVRLVIEDVPEEPICFGDGDEQYYGSRMDEYNKKIQEIKKTAIIIENGDSLIENKNTDQFYKLDGIFKLEESKNSIGFLSCCRGEHDCYCRNLIKIQFTKKIHDLDSYKSVLKQWIEKYINEINERKSAIGALTDVIQIIDMDIEDWS